MKYLITGGNGQLARAFARLCEIRGSSCIAPDRTELDITDAAAVRKAVEAFRPDVIVNCAAYNAVDRAEAEYERAAAINAAGPGILADAAQQHQAFLVHFSSDYVFDGTKEDGLYTESDGPNPLSRYGSTKLDGEREVQKRGGRFLILRMSWVYGEGTQNFLAKLREWAGNSGVIRIACDEFSVPTSAMTAAAVTFQAVTQGLTGLFHLTNSGFCSRYDWARLALAEWKIDRFIRPVPAASFHLPARRPMFSAMSNERLSRALAITIPSWEDDVQQFLREGSHLHA